MSAEELKSLKARAKQMGIPHAPNIGVEKLRKLLNERLAPTEEVTQAVSAQGETKAQRIQRLRKEAHKLVRVIVSCRNPDKTDWEGETFTAGNAAVGSTTKYVPFNNEEGWHVPQIILNVIKERECTVYHWDKKGKHKVKVGKQIPEFTVTILPALTADEIHELKERQAIARSID